MEPLGPETAATEGFPRKPGEMRPQQAGRGHATELVSPMLSLQPVRTHPSRRDTRMSVAGSGTHDEFGKRAEEERGGGVPLESVRKETAEKEAGTEARWKGEVGEWPRWTDGSDGEGEEDDVSTGWRSDEEEVCAACEEAWPDTEAAEEDGESSRPAVAVKVLVKDGARASVLDSACYSI
jgi:hypothetical protein